jgi:hypothetical protein
MWTIWKERNQRTFEDVSKTDNQILEGFIQTLFDWSKTWGFSSCTSILNLFLLCICFLMMYIFDVLVFMLYAHYTLLQ